MVRGDQMAAFIHMLATKSKMRSPKQTFCVSRICGHVMVHKSDFRRFMLQFAALLACYKAPSDLSQRPRYASRARPFFRENHTSRHPCNHAADGQSTLSA